MLYLHGIDHNTQHQGTDHDVAGAVALSAFLLEWCRDQQVEVLAEEFSTEACESYRVDRSICRAVAGELGIVHVFCDPNSAERTEVGIPSQKEIVEEVKRELGVRSVIGPEPNALYEKKAAEYYAVREAFWLKKLEEYWSKTIMFVLGSAHVDSFSMLLSEAGWQYEVV